MVILEDILLSINVTGVWGLGTASALSCSTPCSPSSALPFLPAVSLAFCLVSGPCFLLTIGTAGKNVRGQHNIPAPWHAAGMVQYQTTNAHHAKVRHHAKVSQVLSQVSQVSVESS